MKNKGWRERRREGRNEEDAQRGEEARLREYDEGRRKGRQEGREGM